MGGWEMKTDTPRTYAAEPQLYSNAGGWVKADFARQLERELAVSLENELKTQAELSMWRDGEIMHSDHSNEIDALKAEVERLSGQLTRAVSIAGVLVADIEDFHENATDEEWTSSGWNDSRISKSLLQKLREEIK